MGDPPQAARLIERLHAKIVMADSAYDAETLRQAIANKVAVAVIPNNPSRACTSRCHRPAAAIIVHTTYAETKP